MRRIVPCAAAVALAAAVLASAAAEAPRAQRAAPARATAAASGPELAVLPASGMTVRPVVDSDGRDAGRVNALVIDAANGVVEYVLIEGRGGFNLNGELIAVPWSTLQTPTLRDPLRLKISLAQLENAPRIKRDVLHRLNEPAWRSRVYGYFGSPYPYAIGRGWYGIYGPLGGGVTRTTPPAAAVPPGAVRAGADGRGTAAGNAKTTVRTPPLLRHMPPGIGLLVTPSGGIAALAAQRPAPAPGRPAAVATSTDVFAHDGVEIGHIAQILIDTHTGRIAFVRIAKHGMLGVHPVVYPLPIEALRWSGYRDALRLTADARLLREVPATPLDRARLTTQVSEAKLARLYRYFGVAPYWIGEPAAGAEASAASAGNLAEPPARR